MQLISPIAWLIISAGGGFHVKHRQYRAKVEVMWG
jgi:hypothetical protein